MSASSNGETDAAKAKEQAEAEAAVKAANAEAAAADKAARADKAAKADKAAEAEAKAAAKAAEAAVEEAEATEAPKAATNGAGDVDEMSIGELVLDVSERASILVREEIELAKTEVSEKLSSLLRGSIIGIAAGVFVLAAVAMLMNALAWGLNDAFFGDNFWAGFLAAAGIFILLAGLAGLIAWRALKKGAPPVPEMAIEQAREIKASFETEEAEK